MRDSESSPNAALAKTIAANDLQGLIDSHIENAWSIFAAPQPPPFRLFAIRLLMPILEHQL